MRVAVIDDEPLARTRIRKLLAEHNDMEFIGDARNGREGLELIDLYNPELIFLDIGMPDMDGFEVISSQPSDNHPYIIFSTAYPEHAVKAFEFDAVDYLLKPYNKKRFNVSLDKARRFIQLRKKVTPDKVVYQKEIVISERGREDRVNLEHVELVQSFGNYVKLKVNDRHFLYRSTMTRFVHQLDPQLFLRVHRSYIINLKFLDHITYLNKNEYQIRLLSGQVIISGRKYMPEIKKHLSHQY